MLTLLLLAPQGVLETPGLAPRAAILIASAFVPAREPPALPPRRPSAALLLPPPAPAARRASAALQEPPPVLPANAELLRLHLLLPAALPPPVRRDVFGGLPQVLAPPKSLPQRTRDTGFDQAAAPSLSSSPAGSPTRQSGFDIPAAGRTTATASVLVGAFGRADAPASRSDRYTGRLTAGTGFDQRAVAATPPALPALRSTTFDEPPVVPGAPPATRQAAVTPVRPVEILEKPRPAYSPEARRRKIEGEVLIEVIFKASGEVQVLRVIRGLGYGLDAAAEEAVRGIRFHPATQSGQPVDERATVHVVFRVTE